MKIKSTGKNWILKASVGVVLSSYGVLSVAQEVTIASDELVEFDDQSDHQIDITGEITGDISGDVDGYDAFGHDRGGFDRGGRPGFPGGGYGPGRPGDHHGPGFPGGGYGPGRPGFPGGGYGPGRPGFPGGRPDYPFPPRPNYPDYPSSRPVVCIAADRGFEEHGRAHQAYGYNLYQVQREAIFECQRFHDRCEIRSCNYY